MQRFAEMFERLDETTGTNEKVAALVRYYREVDLADKIWATLLLRSKVKRTPLTSHRLRASFQRQSGVPAWLLDECYQHVGDSAETLALLLNGKMLKLDLAPEERTLDQWINHTLVDLRDLPDEDLDRKLNAFWRTTRPEHWFLLNKLLTGSFRVGVSERLVLKALSIVTEQSESTWHQWLLGKSERDFTELERVFRGEVTARETLQALPFCLASPADPQFFVNETPTDYSAEWKWDGIRAQIIKKGDRVWIWSRGEDMVTESFPEIAQMAASWGEDAILDGEILAWENDRPHDFHVLQKRLGRKKIGPEILKSAPVSFIAYDLLHFRDEDYSSLPLDQRRAKLEEFVASHPRDRFRISPLVPFADWEEAKSLQLTARARGAEGLMLKRKASPYISGRKRGVWFKFKVDPLTLDAVLLYAQAGTGKRSNLFTDYTFALWKGDELVPFAKAYSGLDNAEIEKLDRWIRRNTKEKFGPVRSLKLEHVFEIGFEGIGPSPRHKSGIAVRFPRILRWRSDKKPADADKLEDAWKLIGT